MGISLSDELSTLTAQPIIDRLMVTIDDIKHNIFTNYIQDYIIADPNETEYTLDYIPLVNTLFVMINGVIYTNNNQHTFYTYNSENNTVSWIFSMIPMEEGFRVAVVYSFDVDANNIPDVQTLVNNLSNFGNS